MCITNCLWNVDGVIAIWEFGYNKLGYCRNLETKYKETYLEVADQNQVGKQSVILEDESWHFGSSDEMRQWYWLVIVSPYGFYMCFLTPLWFMFNLHGFYCMTISSQLNILCLQWCWGMGKLSTLEYHCCRSSNLELYTYIGDSSFVSQIHA